LLQIVDGRNPRLVPAEFAHESVKASLKVFVAHLGPSSRLCLGDVDRDNRCHGFAMAQNHCSLSSMLRLIDQLRDVGLRLREGHFPHGDQYDLNALWALD
jgi:hypothetical protein